MPNSPHDPTCLDVERRFDALLEGRMDPAERGRLERHMATCPACRDLAEVAGALGPEARAPRTPDLTAAVLARTAGAPCDRARRQLCDLVDGALARTDRDLVEGHATRCADCGGTAAVLERLSVEMRRMAVVEPDPRFVRDVMRATLGPDGRWRLLAARLSRGWLNLVSRPRFGLEAAYVGAMVLFVLFGLPFSPLRGVSERALAFTQRGSAAVADYSSAVSQMPDQVATLGGKAWDATGAQGVASLREAGHNISTRYDRTAPAREALRGNGDRLRRAARAGDVPAGRDALQDMGTDLGEFMRLISDTDAPDTDNNNRPPGTGRG